MAEPSPASSSHGPPQENGPPTANVQVLSPSVGVNRPLTFAGLPASTTVRQLKENIRNTLATKPAGDQQRLIYRGRLLARDSETLQDVFGAETLQSGDQQTLHLVLRDLPEPRASSQNPTPLHSQSPAPGSLPTRSSESQLPLHTQHVHARLGRATPVQGPPNIQAPIPDLGHSSLASQLQIMQRQHEAMVHQTTIQWMNQIQREAGYRQLLGQQQRERAVMGMHGVQDSNPHGPSPGDNASGRNSPAIGQPTHNVTREVIGPNGQYWRMTVGEGAVGPRTNSPQPNTLQVGRGALGPAEVHNIIRNADTTQATRAMTNAMHRSASGASLANMANTNAPIQPIPPGVTTPLFPNGSRHGSRTATPDPSLRTPSHGSTSTLPVSQNIPQTQPSQGQPEVYILSSPSGPRALLVNSASELYFTPSLRPQATLSFRPNIPPRQPAHQILHWTPQIQYRAQPQGQQAQVQLQQPQPQGQNEDQAHALGAQPAPGAAHIQPHPHNPGAGALMAVAWPHIWLIIRLTVFVWWFTAYDTSWSRWFAVVSIAIAVFTFNTGLLNGMANQVWEPFRRHLEGLIPFADPANAAGNRAQEPRPAADAAAAAGENAAAGPVTTAAATAEPTTTRQVPPDPEAAAARLVADRRNANANWLLDRVRRLERAGLLFLASIAPGVAERHIANLEAQERAEAQRREAEETAAREAAAQEAAAREAAEKEAAEGATEGAATTREAAEKEAAEGAADGAATTREAEAAHVTTEDGWAEQVGDDTREPVAA